MAQRLLEMKLIDAISKYPEVKDLTLVKMENLDCSDMNDKLLNLINDPSRKDIARINTVIVFDENTITGWAWFHHRRYWDRKRYYSVEIFVRPEYRRKGYGTCLFKYIKRVVWKKRKRKIQIYPWDLRSEDFYTAIGAMNLE